MADQEVPTPRPSRKRTAKAESTGTTDPTDNRGIGGNGGDTPPKGRAKAAPRATARVGSFEDRLAGFLGMAAIPFALQGDDYCAFIIASRTPELAKSLTIVANENAAVKRILSRMLEGSAWGGVALSVVGIAVPIAQHHGLVPGSDPFATQYPKAPPGLNGRPVHQAPPAGFGGWSQPTATDGSAMGAPAPTPTDDAGDGDYTTTMPGAPPGVVTVAATSAGHTGAK